MATKNLARTVIEGGRATHNKGQRYHSHRVERARMRDYADRARSDPELWDAACIELRPSVHKGFDDKLGPCRRWLRSKLGTPWNDVRAEIARTFDTRTLAGRHIVHDHMLREVLIHDVERARWGDRSLFIVDEHGILRNGGRYPRKGPRNPCWWRGSTIDVWAAGRRVGRRGGKLYWFVPVAAKRESGAFIRHRQHHALDPAEAAFYERLCPELQARIAFPLTADGHLMPIEQRGG